MFKLKKWLALLAIGIMGGIASFAGTAKATSVSHVIDLDHLRSHYVRLLSAAVSHGKGVATS